ncbi:hypothetical protein [Oscillibacter sp.]|uniref:hypothetical protein n=1 Tax=Oscillibacter sp. TaxID=1945593 RepID=UPI0033946996
MLTPKEITAAVIAAVQGSFPNETVYENLKPRNSERACNMVELTGIALGDVSPGGVELLYTYRITDYVKVDERYNSQLAELALRTMIIVGLFAKGSLKTGDRALKVRSCSSSHNCDYTETLAVLSLSYSRTDFDAAAVLPLMEQLTLTTKTKEDTTL